MKRILINGIFFKTRFGFLAEAEFQELTGKTFVDMIVMFSGAVTGDLLHIHKLNIKEAMVLFFVGLKYGRNEKQFENWQELAEYLDTDQKEIPGLIENFLFDVTGLESPNAESSETEKTGPSKKPIRTPKTEPEITPELNA